MHRVGTQPSEYAKYLAKNGGIANTGNHLGVIITKEKHVDCVPPGWCFLPLGETTAEQVQEALNWMNGDGGDRSKWPTKDTQ